MKGILSFNLPEESDEFKDAQNGWRYKAHIEDIWSEVFRPYYKHGYADPEINKLLENEQCQQLIDKLAELYHKAIED